MTTSSSAPLELWDRFIERLGSWLRVPPELRSPLARYVLGGTVGVWLIFTLILGFSLPLPPGLLYTPEVRDRIGYLRQARTEIASLEQHLVRLDGMWQQGTYKSPMDSALLVGEVYGHYHNGCAPYTNIACKTVQQLAQMSYSATTTTDPNAAYVMGQNIQMGWYQLQIARQHMQADELYNMSLMRSPLRATSHASVRRLVGFTPPPDPVVPASFPPPRPLDADRLAFQGLLFQQQQQQQREAQEQAQQTPP